MNVKYDLVVDFARQSKSNTIMVSENDTNSRLCHFTLLNNKQPMSMSDVTVATVRGIKKDGSVIYGDAKILEDADGHFINEIEYVLPATVTDSAGNVTMTITLMSMASEQITSFEFYVQVRNALYNEDDLVSESDLSGFRDLLNRALVAVKKVEDLSADETLPNPYPITIDLEGVKYDYTGRDAVEVTIKDMAYIAEDPVIDTEDIDRTAAALAAAAAEAAREYANMAKTSEDNVNRVDVRLTKDVEEVRAFKATLDSSVGLAEAYSNNSKLSALVSEGFAKGTQNGVPVEEGSPYYNNNAEYFTSKKSIEDRLDSVRTDRSLSANQGRVLNDIKADKSSVPTMLSQLEEDENHRTVTDAEKFKWDIASGDVGNLLENIERNIQTLDAAKQNKLTAGNNITINDNVISASGATVWNEISVKPFDSIGDNLTVDENGRLNAQAGGGASSWSDLTDKPFTSIGDNLSVENGVLSAQAGGTSDYLLLDNKPQIEGITLTGNKSLSDLDIAKDSEIKDSLTKKQDIIPSYTKDKYLAIRDTLPDGTLVNINDDFDKPYKHWRIYNANTIVVDVEFTDRDDATIQLTNANQGEFLIINPRKAGGLAYRHIYSLSSRNFNVTFANGTLRITYSNGTMWGETVVEGYGITVSNT